MGSSLESMQTQSKIAKLTKEVSELKHALSVQKAFTHIMFNSVVKLIDLQNQSVDIPKVLSDAIKDSGSNFIDKSDIAKDAFDEALKMLGKS